MSTRLPCEFCGKNVLLTANNEFRKHGPRRDPCEGSGVTPTEFPEPLDKHPDDDPWLLGPQQTILGTLAEVAEQSKAELLRRADAIGVGEGLREAMAPEPPRDMVIIQHDGQTQLPNGHAEHSMGQTVTPGIEDDIQPVHLVDINSTEVGGVTTEELLAPTLPGPSNDGNLVTAPPTPDITDERLRARAARRGAADAQVKARREPARPAWIGTQRMDSLGADVVMGRREAVEAAMDLVRLRAPLSCDIESEGLGGAARYIKSITFSESPTGRIATIFDPRDNVQAKMVTWIFDHAPELVFHNSPFDVPQLAINGLFRPEHAAKVTDTLLYARGAEPDNNVPKSLGACCERYLGIAYDAKNLEKAGKAAGMRSKEQIFRDMDLDRPVYARGAAADAVVTARLLPQVRRAYLERLTTGHPFGDWGTSGQEAHDLVEREQKLNRMSLRRTCQGFRVDFDYLDQFNAKQAGNLHKAEQALGKHGVRPGNANDLTSWLDERDLIPPGYPRTAKTEKLSGAKDHLERLGHPLARLFRWHKEQTHVLHDYLEKMRDLAVERGGDMVIFPVVNYFGATTGRMSVGSPPIQQFPGDARGMILAPANDNFTSIDWSQIEPVVIANVSGETDVLHRYENEGAKFYTVVSDLTGIPYKQAKTQLLGTLYGQGLELTAAKLGVDTERAAEIKDAIFRPMPKVLEMTHTLRKIGREHRMIPTISGRIIPIPMAMWNGEWSVATHKAVNYHVQGSAYDVLADRALEVEHQGLGDAIHLLMHDELVVSTDAAHDIRKIMETPPERLIQHSGRTPILHTDTADLGERWAAA